MRTRSFPSRIQPSTSPARTSTGVDLLVVGITGASGSIYGIRLLEVLRTTTEIELHLIVSAAGKRTLLEETDYSVADVEALAHHRYDVKDVGAALASGSFRTGGMVIAPCSIKTAAAIAACYADTLIARAADVTLKERRPLVLMVRETPLHLGHLENMTLLTRMGAIIFPPVPAFYHRPKTLDDVINQTVTRNLDQFGIDVNLFERWSDEGMSRHPEADFASAPSGREREQEIKKSR